MKNKRYLKDLILKNPEDLYFLNKMTKYLIFIRYEKIISNNEVIRKNFLKRRKIKKYNVEDCFNKTVNNMVDSLYQYKKWYLQEYYPNNITEYHIIEGKTYALYEVEEYYFHLPVICKKNKVPTITTEYNGKCAVEFVDRNKIEVFFRFYNILKKIGITKISEILFNILGTYFIIIKIP